MCVNNVIFAFLHVKAKKSNDKKGLKKAIAPEKKKEEK